MKQLYQSPCYCTNARRNANLLSEFYDAVLKPSGLTTPQYYLLINLSRMGSANITHWAERVGLDRSTMVRNLRPLQARRLIQAAPGHGKTFTLSSEGVYALDTAIPLWNKAQSLLEEFLGKEDAAAILRINQKLAALDLTAL